MDVTLACSLWLADALLPRDAVWVWYATNWRIALHFSTYFAFGAALRLAPPRRLPPIAAAVMAAVALMFFANSPVGYALSSVCIPLLVISIARVSAAPSQWLSAKGDLSYGAYLYAFPIQQSVLLYWGGLLNGTTIFLVSLGLTLFAAWLSWHWIETPALRWKPRRASARAAPGNPTEGRAHLLVAPSP